MKYKLSFEDEINIELILMLLRNQFYDLNKNPDEYLQVPPTRNSNKYVIFDVKNEEKIIDYCINQCIKNNLNLNLKPLTEKRGMKRLIPE